MNILEIILGAKKALEELGAKKEPGAVLTWDGDTSNAIDIGGQLMVKVHNKYMDLHGIASITIKGKGSTVEKTEMPDLSSLIDEDGIQSISVNDIGAAILSVSAAGAEMLGNGEGVYIAFASNAIFISKITFAETIHPIDPKFIPGAVLPVVELSEATMATLFASGKATCTAKETDIIIAAMEKIFPLVVKGSYAGISFGGVTSLLIDADNENYYEVNTGVSTMRLTVSGDEAHIGISS